MRAIPGTQLSAEIEKHEHVRRDERLFRLLLPYGDAGVIDDLDAIAGPGVTTLSPGRGDA